MDYWSFLLIGVVTLGYIGLFGFIGAVLLIRWTIRSEQSKPTWMFILGLVGLIVVVFATFPLLANAIEILSGRGPAFTW